ncbi:MAG: mercuric reductase [Bacteroidetes bacterium CG12_big_fil_rev_8_21_14_0_65_60_17]|nr:MAG: mercuric reductase [Bacteroidetes bacterium CG12_big_fil_rev_8_21_14_0_65_60_17]
MTSFDYVILGTGQALGTLLGKLIPTGKSIAVVEGARVGGSCVNYGCTPTKTLVASARAIHQARRGDEFGFRTSGLEVNYERIRERMNSIRNGSTKGLTNWMESTDNVTLFRGWGHFVENRVIGIVHPDAGSDAGLDAVGTGPSTRITGETVFINTGTRPSAPPIEGLDSVPWMDSAGLLDLEELPEHLLVLGGGYIGAEFSQIFRRFGSKVTLIQRSDRIMPGEDEDVSGALNDILTAEGVRIRTGTETTRVGRTGSGGVVLDTNHGRLVGSHLLVAAGRKPNSDRLALENTAIRTDSRGFIQVDDHCRTDEPGVFALGDVNGEGAFTHTAVNDAEIALDTLFGGTRTVSLRNSIYALFTDPPLGRVGLTEREALGAGHRVLKATRPMAKISRAKEMSETQGFAKLLVDADTDLVLGASVLGPGGDEIINMFAAIMHSGIVCRNYRQVVLVHPTVSELMPFVLDGLEEV